MKDIFDNKIICTKCNIEMKPLLLIKSGFKIRTIICPNCKEKTYHPSDIHQYNQYNSLKKKTYKVKLRIVGNSHAISIPKEIIEFINEINQNMKRDTQDIVKLCFEDFGKISLRFIE